MSSKSQNSAGIRRGFARRRDRAVGVGVAVALHAAGFVALTDNLSPSVAAGGGAMALGLLDGLPGVGEAAPASASRAASAEASIATDAAPPVPRSPMQQVAAPLPSLVPPPAAVALTAPAADAVQAAGDAIPVRSARIAAPKEAAAANPPEAPPKADLKSATTAGAVEFRPREVRELKPREVAEARPVEAPPLPEQDVAVVRATVPETVAATPPDLTPLPPKRPAHLARAPEPRPRPQPKPVPRAERKPQPKPIARRPAPAPALAAAPSVATSDDRSNDAVAAANGPASDGAPGAGGAGQAASPDGGAGGKSLASLPGRGAAADDGDARRAYAAAIRALLEREKRYPRRARARGRQGVAVVRFTVTRTGEVAGARIDKGSGVRDLDRETLDMLDRAGRLPPIPNEIASDRLTFVFPVAFSLR